MGASADAPAGVSVRPAAPACPRCGKPRLAELPVGASWSAFAPRLEAHVATLAGVYGLSRRQVQDVAEQMFGIPISLGAVDAVIMRMSVILKDPWEQLHTAIQRAQQVHADETGWRLKGAYECPWVATTALAACYRIDPTRSQAAAKELLGEQFGGFVISDRYVGYHWLDVLQQQLCWAHWVRSLVALSERPGAPGALARKRLKAAREAIHVHHEHLAHAHDLDWLREQLQPLREQIQTLLEDGARGHDTKTANYCTGLLGEYDALWTFCDVQDLHLPIDNNAAESHSPPRTGRNPVRSRQPLDRADPLDPRNDAPPGPARPGLPHPSRDRRPPPPTSAVATRRRAVTRPLNPLDPLNGYVLDAVTASRRRPSSERPSVTPLAAGLRAPRRRSRSWPWWRAFRGDAPISRSRRGSRR